MHMVQLVLLFIKAVRNADWDLHLSSLEAFTKYFFAYDKLHYARMIPLYLAEMKALKHTNPLIWEEFQNDNWVVNKTSIPFCAIGADHALEHLNGGMKVAGGLVGITLNENARVRFFLTAPRLNCLADETKTMDSVKTKSTEKYHSLSAQITSRQLKYTESMISTFNNFTNPFSNEGADLINLLTKSVMEESVKEDMKRQDKIGQNKFELFCTERIKSNSVSLWAPMKKAELKTFKTASKRVKIKVKDTVTELKEGRGLFARMLIVARSRQEIDLKESLSTYEFSVVPRVLFSHSVSKYT